MKIPTKADRAGWPKPNYVNPEQRSDLLIGFEVTFSVLAVIFMLARMYCARFQKRRPLGWDDWLMAVATLLLVIMTAVNSYSATMGLGKHFWDFKPSWIKPVGMVRLLYHCWRKGSWLMASQLSLTEQVMYPIVVSLTKISILLLYLKIFPAMSMHYLAWGGIIWLTGYAISMSIAALLQCLYVICLP